VFIAAVHHRATGCPDSSPRKLVRTTVSNDAVPSDAEVQATEPLDLSIDRVNAEYASGAVAGHSATETGNNEL